MGKILLITGQTATGKTRLAIDYANKYNGELINADSRQVYKGLDIVSGKDLKDLKNTPIHLYDIVDPKENFSSYEWVKLVKDLINKLFDQKKTPIIVGGTYLYLSHLLYGITTEGIKPDWDLRKKLSKKSVQELQAILKKYSQELFGKLNNSDRNNPQRLIRKIEIAQQNTFVANENKFIFTDFFKGIDIEFSGLKYINRNDLRNALRDRVLERLQYGAIDEVKSLLQKGYELHDPGLSSNACLEIHQYLIGQISYEELIEIWVTIEMQYAKRQYTFMKRDPNIIWKEV